MRKERGFGLGFSLDRTKNVNTDTCIVQQEDNKTRKRQSFNVVRGLPECSYSSLLHKLQHELLSNNSPPCVDRDLHAADLLVDVFHKLDDEINQLVLPEFFQVGVGDEEADVETLVDTRNKHRETGKVGGGKLYDVWATGYR